jgi:hypothetical protein
LLASVRRDISHLRDDSPTHWTACQCHPLLDGQRNLPPQPQQSFAVPRRAINLIEALRRSIAEDKKQPAASRKASAIPSRKRA